MAHRGQGLFGEDLAGMALPFQTSGHGQEDTTDESAFQHVLADLDYWPIPENADLGVNGEGLEAQLVDGAEPAQEVYSDITSLQVTPASNLSPPSSRALSQTIGDVDEGLGTPVEFEVRRSKHVCVELPKSTLLHPKSQYAGYEPPLPPTKERDAVASLMEFAASQGNEEDFIEFQLDSFTFYINSVLYPFEMRPLHYMATRKGHDQFYFDGVLSFGNAKHYVQKVAILELPVGNYGTSHASAQGQIWVRSKLNSNREVYYRLNTASTEYARFHTPFVWVADLAKHVVDYVAAMIERRQQVDIYSFKAHFMRWLRQTHGESREFRAWSRKHPSDDYRTSISANIEFIWKEMNGVLGGKKAMSLQLFRETMYFSQYKQTHPPAPSLPMVVQGGDQAPPTIVTPFINDCFGHMLIGKMFKVIGNTTGQHLELGTTQLSNGVAEKASIFSPTTAPTTLPTSKRTRTSEACFLPMEAIDGIKVGDTISTPRDGASTGTKWRNMASEGAVEDGRWFCLVQKVHIAKDNSRSFDVSWFYRPVDTPCCLMKYPWPNELFLSDHCTCEEGRDARIEEHQILATHDIDWFGSPNGNGEFFVRQTYIIESRRWVTLEKSHIGCSHSRQKLGFKTGDAVLVSSSQDSADPHEVVKVFRQGENMFVRLRKLLRRSQVDPRARAAPNELVYSDQLTVVKPDRVIGKCTVRFFRPREPIPTPYDRGGTGCLFYITHRLERQEDGGEQCVPYDGDFPTSLRQGFDPATPIRKLRGMDLFCGSGNFGRGLEEGGAVEMRWANDIWDRAIHTYMANTADPKATKPFLGSVDDLLRLALEGKFSDKVPRPGEVEFISAGSPCPGFSLLTADKTTLAQMKNQSLVASFASFVDFYRPKYGILENVSTIVQARHNRNGDFLSQLFCAIVGMGYQAQLILGDAWSHGAPQSRNRVFLYFAAPGLPLPSAPLLSHSHYPGVNARGLGEMTNNEPFVSRSFQPTPFPYVSAAAGTSDLPLIGDGKAEPGAIAFPDHRVCAGVTFRLRHQIAAIPTHPHGMSFAKAWREGTGVMTPAERALFPAEGVRVSSPISVGWRRVRPADVFGTVTTHSQPTDARAGTGIHWVDDRPLTIQEVRRAQGFGDCEVLLGTAADQWKLVGNSVARQMAVALGLRFREAWVGGVGGHGGREGSQAGSGSGSVSVEAASVRGASVSVVGSVRTGKRNGHRRSTPREVRDVAADTVRATPRGNGHSHKHVGNTSEVIDLNFEGGTHNIHCNGITRDVVDLTSVSRSTTPASATSETVKNGGIRKRLLSQSLGPDFGEMQSRKVICLEGAEASPVPVPEPEPEPVSTNGVSGPWTMHAELEIAARTGPTVVRLWTPDEIGSDGLGPGDDLS